MAGQIKKLQAFTLIEILVVISIIGLLTAIFVPALAAAKSQAHAIACRSNLRYLVLANTSYSNDNDGSYVLAAEDIAANSKGGNRRWHGVRQNANEPFDSREGPLVEYLADGLIKRCPQNVAFVQNQGWQNNFEQGNGGYGYNMVYIGSGLWQNGLRGKVAYEVSANASDISKPDETLMFADTAISNEAGKLMEYSFAEPPFPVYAGRVYTASYASPSIHFRHRGMANVGWADAHVDSRLMAEFNEENAYGVISADMDLGWFEPLDNSLFDLE